jgi:hypothetical protein
MVGVVNGRESVPPVQSGSQDGTDRGSVGGDRTALGVVGFDATDASQQLPRQVAGRLSGRELLSGVLVRQQDPTRDGPVVRNLDGD